jgi:hypothetical protein
MSALPSPVARALAFIGIIVGGALGGLVGAGFAKKQCTGNCATPIAAGALVGSVLIALGSAVVAVLALRALGEWKNRPHL